MVKKVYYTHMKKKIPQRKPKVNRHDHFVHKIPGLFWPLTTHYLPEFGVHKRYSSMQIPFLKKETVL